MNEENLTSEIDPIEQDEKASYSHEYKDSR